MRELIDWLMAAEQKEVFEIVFALSLNMVFLILIASLLWPLGKTTMALKLAMGYLILWVAIYLTALLLNRLQQLFGVNFYDHSNVFIISNLAASCLLQVGWAVFAAATIQSFLPGMRIGTVLVLYLVGGLSCLIAFYDVAAFYQGHVYKLVSLPLALISYISFSVWPI